MYQLSKIKDYKLVVDGILDKFAYESKFGKLANECRMVFYFLYFFLKENECRIVLSSFQLYKRNFIMRQTNFGVIFLTITLKLYASHCIFDYIHLISFLL